MRNLIIIGFLVLLSACARTDEYPFDQTDDVLVLASDDGTVFLINVNTDETFSISSPSVYNKYEHFDPIYVFPPRVSPNGQWMILSNPDGTGTWLLQMDGGEQKMISDQSMQFTWSPDSTTLAFTDAGNPNPNVLFLQRVSDSADPQKILEVDGKIIGSAWSPTANEVAIAYTPAQETINSRDVNGINNRVMIVDIATGDSRILGHLPSSQSGGTAWDLMWAPSGKEVIYFSKIAFLSFPLNGTKPIPLAFIPIATSFQLENEPYLWSYPNPYRQNIAISQNDTTAAWIEHKDDEYVLHAENIENVDKEQINSFILELQNPAHIEWINKDTQLLIVDLIDGMNSITIIDPSTGTGEWVANNVLFLGTLNSLLQTSTNVAPIADLVLLPTSDNDGQITNFTNPDIGISFEYPAEWNIWNRGNVFTISNFNIDGFRKWAPMSEHAIQISVGNLHIPTNMQQEWLEGLVYLRNEATWESIMINGREGVTYITDNWCESILIPFKDKVLFIDKCPSDTLHSDVFQQIINSMTFIEVD